jgi:sortase A
VAVDEAIRARPRGSLFVRTVRGVGWTLIATGVLILLYLVYLLFFTNLETNAAQEEFLSDWELEYGAIEDSLPGEDVTAPETSEPIDVSVGDKYAVIWFERGGEMIVMDHPWGVVEGTSVQALKAGPGHYADTAGPGEEGNLAIAGHRTTYGAPFSELQDLQVGDEVHVVDRSGVEWVYVMRERRIVAPADVWVIGPDPLGEGGSWLTLTTCHPRWSAAQRMIIFAELQGSAA